jgi:hypothetical protein
MSRSPSLVLVDPAATERASHRQRVLSITVGIAVAAASAIPFVLTLPG